VVHNPLEMRVRGNRITLPVDKSYITENKNIKRLDDVVIHTKNSLGFRGQEPPENFDNHLTIIAVGGSTTECKHLSDDKVWTQILEYKLSGQFTPVWINNAGLDGHSTFGHIILMEDYISKLKPKITLFLIGTNDVGRSDLSGFELQHIRDRIDINSLEGFVKSVSSYSETFSLLLNAYRYYRAKKMGLDHSDIDVEKLESLRVTAEERVLAVKEATKHLPAFEKRLSMLIKIARDNGVDPVFITQPALFGDAIDDITGTDLGKMRAGHTSGKVHWEILQAYNKKTKELGKKEKVLVIDLANELPKSTRYFYDFYHFTNEGATKVAEILNDHLSQYFEIKYGEYAK